jgi:hypothetical protein
MPTLAIKHMLPLPWFIDVLLLHRGLAHMLNTPCCELCACSIWGPTPHAHVWNSRHRCRRRGVTRRRRRDEPVILAVRRRREIRRWKRRRRTHCLETDDSVPTPTGCLNGRLSGHAPGGLTVVGGIDCLENIVLWPHPPGGGSYDMFADHRYPTHGQPFGCIPNRKTTMAGSGGGGT